VDRDSDQVIGPEPARKPRHRRSIEEKRRIVEATLVPGASIARVARAYEVNANQLFHWRKLYRQGVLETASASSAKLLPVHIAELPPPASAVSSSTTSKLLSTVHVEVPGKARVRIESCDQHFLRTILECLLQ
jgi:transposase